MSDTKIFAYILFDFNKEANDDNSTLQLLYTTDVYGTPSLAKICNVYGVDITKDGYISNTLGISTSEYLGRENIKSSILLHKLIDEGDENGAIALVNSGDSELDVNYSFNHRIPIYSAMLHKMFRLVRTLVALPTFNSSVKTESWNEPILTTLLYLYSSDVCVKDKDDDMAFREMVSAMLECPTLDLNDQDLNLDSAVNICCESPRLEWVALNLIQNPVVNVNIVNDYNGSALSNAIRQHNTKVLKALGKRPDLIVRSEDETLAKESNITLADFIKPEPMAGLENVVRTEPRKAEFDFEALWNEALAACSAH